MTKMTNVSTLKSRYNDRDDRDLSAGRRGAQRTLPHVPRLCPGTCAAAFFEDASALPNALRPTALLHHPLPTVGIPNCVVSGIELSFSSRSPLYLLVTPPLASLQDPVLIIYYCVRSPLPLLCLRESSGAIATPPRPVDRPPSLP